VPMERASITSMSVTARPTVLISPMSLPMSAVRTETCMIISILVSVVRRSRFLQRR